MEGGGVGGEGGGGGGEEGAAESKRRRGKSGPSTYHRLEDQINLQHLEELMEVFHVRRLQCVLCTVRTGVHFGV